MVNCPSTTSLKINHATYWYRIDRSWPLTPKGGSHDETTRAQEQCNCREECVIKPSACEHSHSDNYISLNYECERLTYERRYGCLLDGIRAKEMTECSPKLNSVRRKRVVPNKDLYFSIPLSVTAYLAFYRAYDRVLHHALPGGQSPIVELGSLTVDLHGQLYPIPAYVRAVFRHEHLRTTPQRDFGPGMSDHMHLMGQLETDDRGHLIPHSLGGEETELNIVPQAASLNRGFRTGVQFVNGVSLEGVPTSLWRRHERLMVAFLRSNPLNTINFAVVVVYTHRALFDPNYGEGPNQFYRPTHFVVEITHINPDGTTALHSHVTYRNDDSFHCHYEES